MYVGGVYNDTCKSLSPILTAVEAAMEIIEEFDDCVGEAINISIALHCGMSYSYYINSKTPIMFQLMVY